MLRCGRGVQRMMAGVTPVARLQIDEIRPISSAKVRIPA
jgi:hypothetical protein